MISVVDTNSNRVGNLDRFVDQKPFPEQLDDVKNESVKNLLPNAVPKSEKTDELMLNLTRQDVFEFCRHAWNDVYWLANLVIWMGFFALLLSHHFDLRLQMVGARMRIACCSLIYRKVSIYFIRFKV